MPDIEVNGARLFYEESGSGPETIVFSHSYLINGRHFHYQVAAFQDRYRCLSFDHRGHGKSEVTKDGYDMENLYADAVELIEKTRAAPCHFVGLSTGGFIGIRLGIRRPDLLKSLVLMDTSADVEPAENMKQYKLLMWVVKLLGYKPVINKVLPLFFAQKFLNDPQRRDELLEWKAAITANDKRAMVKFGRGIFGRESMVDQLDQIKTPTLVIVGQEDQPTPVAKARVIAEGIDGAELVIIANAGHICPVEKPDVVTKAIGDFISTRILHENS